MKGCRAVQVLAKTGESWKPKDGDEDFEIDDDYFLTRIATEVHMVYRLKT